MIQLINEHQGFVVAKKLNGRRLDYLYPWMYIRENSNVFET